jgi:hypothetical protein
MLYQRLGRDRSIQFDWRGRHRLQRREVPQPLCPAGQLRATTNWTEDGHWGYRLRVVECRCQPAFLQLSARALAVRGESAASTEDGEVLDASPAECRRTFTMGCYTPPFQALGRGLSCDSLAVLDA